MIHEVADPNKSIIKSSLSYDVMKSYFVRYFGRKGTLVEQKKVKEFPLGKKFNIRELGQNLHPTF